jgi:hypothetical protein
MPRRSAPKPEDTTSEAIEPAPAKAAARTKPAKPEPTKTTKTEPVEAAKPGPAKTTKTAKAEPTKATKAEPAKAEPVEAVRAAPAEPEPTKVVEAEPAEADEPAADEPAFANRAERRAHGKKKSAQPQGQKGHFPHGKGAVQGPRMWGNRRSG